ncbi:TPA: glycosyl transferase [candidate division WOR-3 bacterium]|jgi:glycosyltransferase involved in cell wall biosynthesis|uniref:Glycosyl transferase n=1 Tax=candidate division WOR-3 bacterium TaxID=2052148 RepID=A0A350HAE5_UNCW3|nr:glycosyl transferase [candidate division WOR-3 bacterium]
MKLSVIIPAYNEKEYILQLIEKVLAVKIDKEVIIVDDMSKDGTREILQKIKYDNVRVFFHTENKGKAGAIRTGAEHATGDIVIIQDADLEYDPEDYPILIKPIIEEKCDVVYGNRFSKENVGKLTLIQFLGNMVMTLSTSLIIGKRINDMETCYKTVRADYFKRINITSKGFGIDPEITIKLLKMKARLMEVPIRYYPRDYNHGKKIKPKDAIRTFYTIIKMGMID